MSASIDTPAPVLIQGIAHTGHLIHALRDEPKQRSRMQIGNLRFLTRALCGMRGMTANGWYGFRLPGGHEQPRTFSADISGACSKCVRLVRQSTANATDG